jgi:hypothetical protein
MGFEVSFPDSLEKYGILGALVFAALAAGAAAWWSSIVKAIEAYQKQRRKRLKAVVFRPLATFLLVLVPLLAAIQIVSAKKADLRRAARLLDGRWDFPASKCRAPNLFRVDQSVGVLVIRTADGFRFIHEFEAIEPRLVQVRQRGVLAPHIYEFGGPNVLVERTLGFNRWELVRC